MIITNTWERPAVSQCRNKIFLLCDLKHQINTMKLEWTDVLSVKYFENPGHSK